MNIRQLNQADYETLAKWWKDWGWDPVPTDFLPENGTGGVIVESEGTPLAAGFVYKSNSRVMWVDWIISTKDRHQKRSEAVDLVLSTLTDYCKRSGAKYIYSLLKHDGLKDRYKKQGFSESGQYNTEMIKQLWQ